MFRHLSQRSFFLAVLVALPAFAGWTVSGEAKAAFKGKTTPMGSIDGATNELTVKDDGKTLTFVVSLKNMTTGIGLRDNHMRDKFLEVQKHPEAKLEVPLDAIKMPAGESGSTSGEAKGVFTVHGQSKKDVPFKYTVTKKGKAIEVAGSFNVNVKEHGIEIPSYLGVTMKPDVAVETSFRAVNQ